MLTTHADADWQFACPKQLRLLAPLAYPVRTGSILDYVKIMVINGLHTRETVERSYQARGTNSIVIASAAATSAGSACYDFKSTNRFI